jgi:hypothetical protein
MHRKARMAVAAVAAIAVAVVLVTAAVGKTGGTSGRAAAVHRIWRTLTPSTPQLAACMPHARVRVRVALTTDRRGFDFFTVFARGLPRNRDFTVFLLEQAGPPFGAAEYIGDISSNRRGRARNTFRLIVQEAFSSTLVNGTRVRVDLNQIGMWFADPKDDDFCLGPNSPVTPFDGDGEAGVQAFNSAHTRPLPAP